MSKIFSQEGTEEYISSKQEQTNKYTANRRNNIAKKGEICQDND